MLRLPLTVRFCLQKAFVCANQMLQNIANISDKVVKTRNVYITKCMYLMDSNLSEFFGETKAKMVQTRVQWTHHSVNILMKVI